jgi:ferrochelatase
MAATQDVLADLAREKVSGVLAVPVSFVSDHLETLQEIDIAYKELASGLGIQEFRRVVALNLYPRFIQALANIVLNSF